MADEKESERTLSSGKTAYHGEIVHCRVPNLQHILHVLALLKETEPLTEGDVANDVPGAFAVIGISRYVGVSSGGEPFTVMQPIVHVTRLSCVAGFDETLAQAFHKITNGIVHQRLHLQEIVHGKKLDDWFHDLRVHVLVAGAEDILHPAPIDEEIVYGIEFALHWQSGSWSVFRRRVHRLKQRRSTGSYLAQETLPGVNLIDHVRIADADHNGPQPDRGAITIM